MHNIGKIRNYSSIKKRRYKNWQKRKNTKKISYILQFIDGGRFMVNSLSNLVNNFSEWIHKSKCKYGHDDAMIKKCETCRTEYKITL